MQVSDQIEIVAGAALQNLDAQADAVDVDVDDVDDVDVSVVDHVDAVDVDDVVVVAELMLMLQVYGLGISG